MHKCNHLTSILIILIESKNYSNFYFELVISKSINIKRIIFNHKVL